jgi:hypothetical protein
MFIIEDATVLWNVHLGIFSGRIDVILWISQMLGYQKENIIGWSKLTKTYIIVQAITWYGYKYRQKSTTGLPSSE